MSNFKDLQNFVDRMKSTSSLNEKKQIIESIKDNDFITNVLHHTYNPYLKYNVTSKNCKKLNHLTTTCPHDTIFNLLKHLDRRTFTGHSAIEMVNGFVIKHIQYRNLIYSIIDRNLEIRANDSVINKIIPNLIPTFDVALATKYEPRFCDFEKEEWLGSRKLDGVRCIIRKEGTCVKAYSRQGNEFTTLIKVTSEISSMSGDFVFDGEICLMDENGNEHFQGLMKQIKRKNHTIQNPKYVIFDYLTLEEFDTKVGTTKLEDRYGELEREILHDGYYATLSLLEQHPIESDEQLADMIKSADEAGYEGIMLRKNTGYEGKRSKNLLKCKKFFDAEYEVVGSTNGDIRILSEGKEKTINALSQVVILHKGHKVGVGSGFSLEQRKEFGKDHSKIIGKTITVQYFEETVNQNGGVSLRFPTVKHVYINGRNV